MKFFKTPDGVSVLESVVSVALIVFIISIFSVSLTSIRLQRINNDRAVAHTYAQSALEVLRSYPADQLINQASAAFPSEVLPLAPAELKGLQALIDIQDYLGQSDLKEVTATVSWDIGDDTKTISLSTLIAVYES